MYSSDETSPKEFKEFQIRADQGFPKSQYIMADHYKNGIGVEKDRDRAKHYYKLLAEHNPSQLEFMNCTYAELLYLIGLMEFNDGKNGEARKYFIRAKEYLEQNYPPPEYNRILENMEMDKYLELSSAC